MSLRGTSGSQPLSSSRARTASSTQARHLPSSSLAPELKGRRIGAIKGYFLKISGDSEMHSQDKDPILIEGQGRWRMHAQEPGEMWIKYRQADVDEKKTVSDL